MHKLITTMAVALTLASCGGGQKTDKPTENANNAQEAEQLGNAGLTQTEGWKTASVKEYGRVTPEAQNVEVLDAPAYPKGSPVDRWGKLKVAANADGVRCLCSQDGKPVQLRGMSSHGLQWKGSSDITEPNIKALSNDWNTNIFRIAVYVDEQGGYAYNPGHRDTYVDNLVKWTAQQGMYLLIDWHVLSPGNPLSPIYRNRPDSGIDLAADFFTWCARRYQNQKHVLYELCNEPNGMDYEVEKYGKRNPDYDVPRVTWMDHVKPHCEQMLKIIRSYDKDVVCICGTPYWDQRPQDVIGNEPNDEAGKPYDNLMYTFHFYASSHNDGRHIETDVKFWDIDFWGLFTKGSESTGTKQSILKDLPVFVTEWGTTDAGGWNNFSPELTDRWMQILDGDNDAKVAVSWCNWSFSSEGGACAALKWDNGNMQPFDKKILSESGSYIFKRLHMQAK